MSERNPKKQILVVEDDEISQMIIQDILKELNYEVTIAEYGKDALKLFKNKKFDMVFMDIALIDMDGFTITAKFRQLTQELNYPLIPIIAVSAYNDKSFKKRASEVGINDYLVKPITLLKCKKIMEKFNLITNN